MSFDFATAIARMEVTDLSTGGGHAALAARYPEMDFIFDELTAYRDTAEKYGDAKEMYALRVEAQEEQVRLYDRCKYAAQRFAQIRDMVEVLTRLDASVPIMEELTALFVRADEAQYFIDKQKDA